MAIADEEVSVETLQIKREMSNTMGAIDAAQNSCLLAFCSETLEREPYARHADNCVEEGHFRGKTFTSDLLDHFQEPLKNEIVATRKLILDFPGHDMLSGFQYTC